MHRGEFGLYHTGGVPRNWWAWLLRKKQDTKKYRITTVVVPNALGTYSLEGAVGTDVKETVNRNGIVEAHNEHCEGERRHGPFRFSATPGWSIEPDSIHLGNVISSNRETSVEGPFDVATTGFYYNMKLQNGGSCVDLVFERIRDARAWRKQVVEWRESRLVPSEQPLLIPAGTISWGNDVSIPIPPGLKWFRATIHQIDGQKRVITDRDEQNDWFSLDHDAEQRTIVIRPRKLSEALAAR